MTPVGVGITTHNRRGVFNEAFASWRQHLDSRASLVVADDASHVPCPDATYRFDTNVGAPRAKNKCLELLYDSGCEHLFLADDDVLCQAHEWWWPYVLSPEPHLCWARPRRRRLDSTREVAGHLVFDWASGAVLYMHRSVLDVVGGYDTEFPAVGFDHINYSDRIHSAGLTRWRFADVTGTGDTFRGISDVTTSVSAQETARAAEGRERRKRLKDVAYYVEFRG